MTDRLARRYETDAKYLEITIAGRRVTHRAGELAKPSEPESTDDRQHRSYAEARSAFDRLSGLFERRGYRLVDERGLPEAPPRFAPVARVVENPALEAECLASPDAAAPWSVYADWLMREGDPRGELAAVHASDPEAYRAHARPLLGDVAPHVELAARFGFVRGAILRRERDDDEDALEDDDDDGEEGVLAQITQAFLALPIARFVDALQFGLAGGPHENSWTATMEVVTASRQASRLRSLRFDGYDDSDSEISWIDYGSFWGAWNKLPALEELRIRAGSGQLGELDLPRLRTFVRISGGLQRDEVEAIANARWPALEHLEIWFGREAQGAGGSVHAIGKILAGEGLPKLRHLGLVNCEFSDELVPALAVSPLLARIETLDLSRGIMAEAACRAMIEHADVFRRLRAIDVGDNFLRDDELEHLAIVLPNLVRGESQRDYDRPEPGAEPDDDGDERYASLGE